MISSKINALAIQIIDRYLDANNIEVAQNLINYSPLNKQGQASNAQINLDEYLNYFKQVELATKDSLLGLHIGEWLSPAQMGLLGYVIYNCNNMAEAFYLTLKYNRLGFSNNTITFSPSIKNNQTVLSMESELPPEKARPWVEFTSAGWISMFQHLSRSSSVKTDFYQKVSFQFSANGNEAEYERVFGCNVLFDQEKTFLVGRKELFSQKIFTADKNSLNFFIETLDIEERKLDFIQSISSKMKKTLPNILSLDEIASQQKISGSTLKRRLREQDTSFNQLYSEVKIRQAKEMLLGKDKSVNDIALHLGYQTPSAFFKLFKQKTGLSPKDYRNQIQVSYYND